MWLFVPIFTGIVVLPATLNIITPGTIVVPLGNWWFGQPDRGHQPGPRRPPALIVTRVAVSISLVVLLTLTTPWPKLMAALRALFVPRMFIQVIGMAYRYIFYLLGSVDDMYTARKSRMVGADTDVSVRERAFVAATAGALFGKAHALSEEVHLAMVSRGYTGNARSIESFHVGAAGVGLDRRLCRDRGRGDRSSTMSSAADPGVPGPVEGRSSPSTTSRSPTSGASRRSTA